MKIVWLGICALVAAAFLFGPIILFAHAGQGMGPGPGVGAFSSGPVTSVTDNFNRANGSLGSNWTNAVGSITISSNTATGTSGSTAYWVTTPFSTDVANQYASCLGGTDTGPVVRQSTTANTRYQFLARDDGAGGTYLALDKVVAGTKTEMTTAVDPSEGYYRLEVSGTTLTAKTGTDGVTWTTRITWTDSAIASGRPGITVNGSTDTFAAGVLP